MHWCKVGGRGGGDHGGPWGQSSWMGDNDLLVLMHPLWAGAPPRLLSTLHLNAFIPVPRPPSGLAAALLSTCLLHGASGDTASNHRGRGGAGGCGGPPSPSDTVLDVVLSRVGLAQFFQRWDLCLVGGGTGGRGGCLGWWGWPILPDGQGGRAGPSSAWWEGGGQGRETRKRRGKGRQGMCPGGREERRRESKREGGSGIGVLISERTAGPP